MGLLFASYRPSAELLEAIPAAGRSFLSAPTAERARVVARSLSSSLPLNDRISLRLHPVVSFLPSPMRGWRWTVRRCAAVRLPAATFVGGARWGQVTGIAAVAGIGFTIALFVTDLAFADPARQQDAKIGILVGSALAALLALAVFRVLAFRGGLCYPEDEQASLPPLAQIPDPD